jgi:hypothetical protein
MSVSQSVSPVQWNNPCLLWDAYKTNKHIERAKLEFLNKKSVGAQETRALKHKFNATCEYWFRTEQ